MPDRDDKRRVRLAVGTGRVISETKVSSKALERPIARVTVRCPSTAAGGGSRSGARAARWRLRRDARPDVVRRATSAARSRFAPDGRRRVRSRCGRFVGRRVAGRHRRRRCHGADCGAEPLVGRIPAETGSGPMSLRTRARARRASRSRMIGACMAQLGPWPVLHVIAAGIAGW
jgi:hypothetical protein